MKKLLFAVFATALFASCAQTEIEVRPIVEATGDFTASFDVESRAELNGTSTLWNETDKITIFTGTSHNRRYRIESLSDDKRTADFDYVDYTGEDTTPPVANFGIYPYDAGITLSGYNITTTINAEQTYNPDKVDLANSIMVAKSDPNDFFLPFKNATALLRFRLTNITPDNFTLSSIKVQSAANLLAGQAVINFEGDVPVTTVSEGEGSSKVVTLTSINTQITNETHDFYISLPATEFAAEDLTVTFTYEGNKSKVINVAKAISLTRGTIYTLKHTITGSDFTGTTDPYEEYNVEVATAEDLTAALQAASTNGGEITLTEDIAMSEILTISGAAATRAAANATITIDGNGKKLTSTAGRAININTTHNVVIKNLTIECTGERGINVIENAANVTLENVDVTAASYAVNVWTVDKATKVSIKNSELTGLNVVNVNAANRAAVTVENTTLNCVDESEEENYAALNLCMNAANSSIAATGCTFNFYGSDSFRAKNESSDGTITIDGSADDVVVMVAAIIYEGGYYYSFPTIKAAIEEAKAGETVTLLRDITSSEIITVNKAITIDGNDKTLTYTATDVTKGRAINVSGANGATIKDLTINCTGERAINVIQNATNVTIDNVTATANNYTICAAGSAANTVITVKNSNLTGLNTVNIAAAGANVTVVGTKITCNDQSEIEGYAALCLNKDATGATLAANGCTFDIINVGSDSVKAKNDAINGTLTIDGSADEVVVKVAAIIYGDYYYSFQTIEKAIEKAIEAPNASKTITILRPIVIDEDVTLNLQGMTITGHWPNSYGAVIEVSEGVTAKVMNGTISSTHVNGNSAIMNYGTLTVEDATLNGARNGESGNASYALNTTGANSKLILNNATINGRGAIGATNGTKVEVNGGTYHTPEMAWGHAVYASGAGTEVVINGGTFTEGYAYSSNGWGMYQIYAGDGSKVIVNNGDFSQEWDCANGYDLATAGTGVIEIKGGVFADNPSSQGGKNFVATGYKVVANSNGTYTVEAE